MMTSSVYLTNFTFSFCTFPDVYLVKSEQKLPLKKRRHLCFYTDNTDNNKCTGDQPIDFTIHSRIIKYSSEKSAVTQLGKG